MDYILVNLLSILIFLPLAGSVVLALLPATEKNLTLFRWGSFWVSVITFALSLLTVPYFQGFQSGHYDINLDWIPAINAMYSLHLDGISLWLVLLNTLLFPLAVLSSIGVVKKQERAYYALLLFLEAAVTGVFLAQDLLLFYVFFEAVLIPMYFLIGIWGGKQRLYATTKFVLYTMVGSLMMLAAFIGMHVLSGQSVQINGDTWDVRMLGIINYSLPFQFWAFLAMFLAFAIKVPLFPFHTWLPDAHTEAPTAGSIILAGVLLKMGTYGFVRFALPICPDAPYVTLHLGPLSFTLRDLIMALAVVGIIYGALVAAVQTDVKRLVAYSSIAHLGFVMLGIFSFTQQALDGAIFQMVAHGISTGALFMLVGFIYDRRHTRAIADFGGLAKPMPVYFNFFLVIMLSSVGLPALNGFVGEFLILIGSWQANWLLATLATSGVILAAVYLLYMFRRVFYGEVTHEENRQLPDLRRSEIASVLPLAMLAFFMGVFPGVFLGAIKPDSAALVEEMRHAENRSEVSVSNLPASELLELHAEGGR